MCKPLVTVKNKNAGLDFAQKTRFCKKKKCVMAWACKAASGTGLLVFIDDVQSCTLSSGSAKCCKSDQAALHSAKR